MSLYDHMHRPVTIEVTLADAVILIACVRMQLAARQTQHGEDDHGVESLRQLIRRLEGATSGNVDSDISHSLVAPEESTSAAASTRAESAVLPTHGFAVERQLPDGVWTTGWSVTTRKTLRWRAMCTCGWRGSEMFGDEETGQEDDAARERAYDSWNKTHVAALEIRLIAARLPRGARPTSP
jgi:hypothetical protein